MLLLLMLMLPVLSVLLSQGPGRQGYKRNPGQGRRGNTLHFKLLNAGSLDAKAQWQAFSSRFRSQ